MQGVLEAVEADPAIVSNGGEWCPREHLRTRPPSLLSMLLAPSPSAAGVLSPRAWVAILCRLPFHPARSAHELREYYHLLRAVLPHRWRDLVVGLGLGCCRAPLPPQPSFALFCAAGLVVRPLPPGASRRGCAGAVDSGARADDCRPHGRGGTAARAKQGDARLGGAGALARRGAGVERQASEVSTAAPLIRSPSDPLPL